MAGDRVAGGTWGQGAPGNAAPKRVEIGKEGTKGELGEKESATQPLPLCLK